MMGMATLDVRGGQAPAIAILSLVSPASGDPTHLSFLRLWEVRQAQTLIKIKDAAGETPSSVVKGGDAIGAAEVRPAQDGGC